MQGLPDDAAVWRKERAWTRQDEFAAATLELLDWGFKQVAGAVSPEIGKKLDKPLKIDRPVDEAPEVPAEPRKRDPRKVAAFFARHFGG